MNNVRIKTCILSLLFLGKTLSCWGSGYEFEGVGAMQVSRAGAAIADADDWTATYWNPGNISRVTHGTKKQVGLEFFGGGAHGKDSNSLSGIPGVGPFSKQSISSSFLLGAIGGVAPIGEKGGIGFSFYTPLLQGVKFSDTSPTSGQTLDYKGAAGILTWNVAGSYAFTPTLSLGAGVDVLYGKISQKATLTTSAIKISSDLSGEGFGLEGVLGVQYDPHPKFSVGAVYRTGSDVALTGASSVNYAPNFFPNEYSNFRFVLRHPPTAGLGFAFKPSPTKTFTFDINRTLWNRFSNAISYDQQALKEVNTPNTDNWRNAWKLRLGAKFVVTDKTNLLFGYSYDEPALDKGSIDLSTSVDVFMNRFSTGVSHKWSDKVETILGVLGGYGRRQEGNVHYQLSGYQVMLESRYTY